MLELKGKKILYIGLHYYYLLLRVKKEQNTDGML